MAAKTQKLADIFLDISQLQSQNGSLTRDLSDLKQKYTDLENEEKNLRKDHEELKAKGKGKGRRCLGDGKNAEVPRLNEGATLDQFRHWIHCVELQLEKAEGWSHFSKVMQKLKRERARA